MIDANYVVINAGRDYIRADTFVRVLSSAGSFQSPLWNGISEQPGARQAVAKDLYHYAIISGVDPGFMLAIAAREHAYGTYDGINHGEWPGSVLSRNDTRSWGNQRSVRLGGIHTAIISDKFRGGPYVKFDSVVDSFQDAVFRLIDPTHRYAKEGRTTIGKILSIWTESEALQYIDFVAHEMADYYTYEAQLPPPASDPAPDPVPAGGGTGDPVGDAGKPLIVMSAGHHNTKGGDGKEISQTGPLCAAAAAELRSRGRFRVKVLTPDDGRGQYPGTYNDLARAIVASDAADRVHFVVEWHTEGNDSGDAGGGAFGIYPDWPAASDYDKSARERFIPDYCRRLHDRTGLRIRTITDPGTMSERRSGVGLDGDRLGFFANTAAIRDHATRVILEVGAHTSPADLRITDGQGFYEQNARAFADALEVFYFGKVGTDTPAPPPERRVIGFHETPYTYESGFAALWDMMNTAHHPGTDIGAAWLAMGYPRSPEFDVVLDGHARRAELTDTGAIMWQPEEPRPWDVRLPLLRLLPAIYAEAIKQGWGAAALQAAGVELVTLADGRPAIAPRKVGT